MTHGKKNNHRAKLCSVLRCGRWMYSLLQSQYMCALSSSLGSQKMWAAGEEECKWDDRAPPETVQSAGGKYTSGLGQIQPGRCIKTNTVWAGLRKTSQQVLNIHCSSFCGIIYTTQTPWNILFLFFSMMSLAIKPKPRFSLTYLTYAPWHKMRKKDQRTKSKSVLND